MQKTEFQEAAIKRSLLGLSENSKKRKEVGQTYVLEARAKKQLKTKEELDHLKGRNTRQAISRSIFGSNKKGRHQSGAVNLS